MSYDMKIALNFLSFLADHPDGNFQFYECDDYENPLFAPTVLELQNKGLVEGQVMKVPTRTTTLLHAAMDLKLSEAGREYLAGMRSDVKPAPTPPETSAPFLQHAATVLQRENMPRKYPRFFKQWSTCGVMLWSSGVSADYFRVAMGCREAVSVFLEEVADQKGIALNTIPPDKLAARAQRLAETNLQILGFRQKLFVYVIQLWTAFDAQIQRQAQEGGELIWDDARRAVYMAGSTALELHCLLNPRPHPPDITS